MTFEPTADGYQATALGSPPLQPTAGPLQADLDADGVPETVYWEGAHVRVERDGATVWQSEPEWHVVDVAAGDIWNDLRQEVILAMWKDDKAGVPRSHPFIMGHRHGRYDLLWGGSAVAAPIRDLDIGDVDGDGQNELVVLEGTYDDPVDAPARFITVWRWNGWGFTLLWRSAEGQYDSLQLLDVHEEGGVEIVVRQR
jgi:poly-gamma-glutamate synthesis protein (capsule biosynthesis protein)